MHPLIFCRNSVLGYSAVLGCSSEKRQKGNHAASTLQYIALVMSVFFIFCPCKIRTLVLTAVSVCVFCPCKACLVVMIPLLALHSEFFIIPECLFFRLFFQSVTSPPPPAKTKTKTSKARCGREPASRRSRAPTTCSSTPSSPTRPTRANTAGAGRWAEHSSWA